MHIRAAQPGKAHLAPRSSWSWHDQAGCQGEDLELFYGPEGEHAPQREKREEIAKQLCNEVCPVRELCLQDALERNDKYGVLGGTDPDERATIRRHRQRKALAAKAKAGAV